MTPTKRPRDDSEPVETTQIRVPVSVVERIKTVAAREERSISWWARKALERALDEAEKHAER